MGSSGFMFQAMIYENMLNQLLYVNLFGNKRLKYKNKEI